VKSFGRGRAEAAQKDGDQMGGARGDGYKKGGELGSSVAPGDSIRYREKTISLGGEKSLDREP